MHLGCTKRLARLIARREIDAGALSHLPSDPSLRCLILPNESPDELHQINVEVIRGDIRIASDPKRAEKMYQQCWMNCLPSGKESN